MKKILLRAKAQLVDAPVAVSDDICQSIASQAGVDSVNQADLLHIRSTLVTSGANENTDVFLKDELWKARKTPIHKPSNWDHKRTKIIGHMFNVEARTLDGRLLDLESDQPVIAETDEQHDGDFELIVDEVVYAFLLPEFAQEIRRRATAGELFVSMEVWFSDFDIAVWTKSGLADNDSDTVAATFADAEFEVLPRKDNEKLVASLRSSNGTGRTDDGKFIGRAMRNLLFGGKGFVAMPGNPRSTIESVGGKPVNLISKSKVKGEVFEGSETFQTAQESGDGWTHSFIVRTTIWDGEVFGVEISGEVKGSSSLEQATQGFTDNILPRISQLGQNALEALKFPGTVESIARRKTVEQFESENRLEYICFLDLEPEEMEPEPEEIQEPSVLASANNLEVHMSADNTKLEQRLEALQAEIETLRTENTELKSNSAIDAVKAEAAAREKKLDEVVQAFAAAPEISRIDEVVNRQGSADELWSAKIQWLFDTASALTKTLADQTEALNVYRTAERMGKVKELDLYSNEHLPRVQKQIAGMSDESFDDWLTDKQVFADQKREYAEKIAALESADDGDVTETDSEGNKAEAAEQALDEAKPEAKPEVTETDEAVPASTASDDADDVYSKLAQKLTDKFSPRQKRLNEKRKNFGKF